jgi:hypothetical protein
MALRSLQVLLVALLAGPVASQAAGPGLSWTAQAGEVRSFFPSCSNLTAVANRGETVSLKVWGDQRALFVLLAAATAPHCLPIPGIGNGLMLDQSFVVVALGGLDQISPCLSCPPGFADLRFTLPPVRAMVAFQAVAYGGNRVAFTVTITATVQ